MPFLASALIVIVGLWIRPGVSETPAFKAARAKRDEQPLIPIVDMLRRYALQLFVAVAVGAGSGLAYQIYITYGTAYTRIIDGDVGLLLNYQALIGFMTLGLTPFFGWLSDIWGRKKVIEAGPVFTVQWVFHGLNAET
ncbi:hypothetical protein ABTZ59_32650 [Streptomyces sp. NPDC094034]|uniref:hypothetical protein n=1 Tax=Streptomyces sp. NPDC094034 TaxID=3155309 RepID=UPI00332D34AE